MTVPPLTVLYDADCGICRLTSLALARLDWRKALDLVPLQEFAAAPEGAAPSPDELLAVLHIRDGHGRWTRGGDAARQIAAAIPVLMPLAVVGGLPGLAGVMDRAYRLVARHRAQISQTLGVEQCALDAKRAGPEGPPVTSRS